MSLEVSRRKGIVHVKLEGKTMENFPTFGGFFLEKNNPDGNKQQSKAGPNQIRGTIKRILWHRNRKYSLVLIFLRKLLK